MCVLIVMCNCLHTHKELCTEEQPSCICSASHTLSGTCTKQAQCSCELPQVAGSRMVCIVLQSVTNPSLLVEGALVLAAESDPTHAHLDTLPS